MGCSRDTPIKQERQKYEEYKSYTDGLLEIRNAEGKVFLKVGCEIQVNSPICIKRWLDENNKPVNPKLALAQGRQEHRDKYGAFTIPSLAQLNVISKEDNFTALVVTTKKFLAPKDFYKVDDQLWIISGTREMLVKLSKSPDVLSIHLDNAKGVEAASGAVASGESMALYSKTLGRQNQYGFFAEQQPVGLMELIGRGCKLPDHLAFSDMTITYEDTNFLSCNTTADCDIAQNLSCSFANNVSCVNGECIGNHATQVTSRIGANYGNGDSHHASRINLYVANGSSSNSAAAVVDRYHWFNDNDVRLVNESITYTDNGDINSQTNVFSPSLKDVFADYFARRYQMTFVVAAGNYSGFDNNPDQVFCHQINGICVGSTDSNQTYGDPEFVGSEYLDDFIDPAQRFANARLNVDNGGPTISWRQTDIERPDFVSNGRNVYAADPTTDNQWERVGGTSFSTPVVTGMIALEKERCDNRLPDRPEFWRSRFRNRTTAHELEIGAPSFYPSGLPGQGYDWFAGTGIPLAYNASDSCDSREENENEGGGWMHFDDVITQGNWTQPHEWMYDIDFDPSTYLTQYDELFGGLLVIPTNNSGTPVNSRMLKMGTIADKQGQDIRIRSSLAFLNCFDRSLNDVIVYAGIDPSVKNVNASGMNNDYLGDLSAWVQFDYVLCGDDTEECYAASMSTYDNNEGFDIILQDNPSDDLSLYVLAQWDSTTDEPLFACPSGEPMAAHWYWATK